MKHSFLFISALCAVLFAACKPEDKVQINTETTTVQFSIYHAGNPAFRKAPSKHNATAKVDGINTLVYAVYDADGKKIDDLCDKQDNAFHEVDDKYTATLSLELVKGQTYSLAFFAYNSTCTAYNTDDLKNISIDYTKLTANDEQVDAFFGNIQSYTVGAAEDRNSVTLRRPFAQLNLAVSDYDKAKEAGVEITQSSLTIKNIATGFNALTGEIKGISDTEITIATGYIPAGTLTIGEEEYTWLSMNYVLAGDATTGSATALSDVTFILSVKTKEETSTTTPQTITIASANTPLQRNHRTNILGKLTTAEDFTVTIDGEFDTPDKDIDLDYDPFSGHEYVDFGLPTGTLWATCNVGADKPEGYGNYYAWGETEPKNNYSWNTYKYGTQNALTKYNASDRKTVLDPEDDAAHVHWGGSWRMPTENEWKELNDNCTWEWTTISGVNGYKVSNKNDSKIFIFLPAAGSFDQSGNKRSYGYYWAAQVVPDNWKSAHQICFTQNMRYYWDIFDRYHGNSVRPVVRRQ